MHKKIFIRIKKNDLKQLIGDKKECRQLLTLNFHKIRKKCEINEETSKNVTTFKDQQLFFSIIHIN